MKRLLVAAATIATVLTTANLGHAQGNPLGLMPRPQALQVKVMQAQALQVQAPAVQAPAVQAPAGSNAPARLPTESKLPDWTFEQLVGDEVVRRDRVHPYAIGAGAIAGVVLFNVVTAYMSPGAMFAGGPLAATVVADSAISASRIYAVTSAVIGGLAGNWFAESFANK